MSEKEELIEILGPENLFDDPETLEGYSKDLSFVQPKKPSCVVRPRRVKEIQEIVKWANKTRASLIPVSSGPPRFRGDTVPDRGGVVVDLSEMRKILRIDRRNRVAMIEPGVTFAELQPELEKEGLRLLAPLLPRLTKSVLGSYLEREPILIPKYHWDMSDPLLCTEVIFGTGDMFRTGSAAGPGTLEEQWASGQAQKNPLGPSQSDLFRIIQGSQGTMGIVTWASVKCELLPKVQKLFFVPIENVGGLIEFVYRILRLRLGDECFILNSFSLASILAKGDGIKELQETLPPWVLIFTVSGYERLPNERVEYQEKDIMDIANEFGLKPVSSIPGVTGGEMLEILSRPSKEPYWKLKFKGGCQDIFFLTTLNEIPEFTKAMNDEAEKRKYPKENLGVYIQPIQQGRSCHCEFNLTFDPADSDEVSTTKHLFDEASKRLMNKGGFFSRPYGSWANMVYSKCAETVIALGKVKEIFDPNKIMNPGKLCF